MKHLILLTLAMLGTTSSAWALSCVGPGNAWDFFVTEDSPHVIEGEVYLQWDGSAFLLEHSDTTWTFLPAEEVR